MTTVEVVTEKSTVEVEQVTHAVEVVNSQPTVEVENGPTVEVTQGAVEIVELEPTMEAIEVIQGTVEVVEVGTEGPPGPAGSKEITRTAAETLSGHRVITHDDDGLAIHADNTNSAHIRRAKWLTTGAVMSGATATLIAEGPVTEGSWSWTPGQPIYLSTSGILTQTVPSAPAFIQEVAVALTATTLYFDPQLPFVTA